MRPGWSRIAALVSTVAVVLAGTSCSSSSESDELLIYNAQHESLTKEWIDAFTKETGIKVTYRQGGDTELGNQLVAEGDGSPADVFLTENSPAMAAVEKAGLFADLDADTLDQVPAPYRPATGKWTGVAARSTVFVYNTSRLQPDQLPEIACWTYSNPQWKGRWGAPPPKADFQAIVAALLQLKGEAATAQWLAGDEGQRGALQRQHRHAEGRECRRGRRRHHLPLLLVPRSVENQRDAAQIRRCTTSRTRTPVRSSACPAAAYSRRATRRIKRSSSSGSSPARPGRRCWRRAPPSSTPWPAACRPIPRCRRWTRCRHPRWTRRR